MGPALAFGVLGIISIWYPELLGNGKDMAYGALFGLGSFSLLLALSALKPLVTALCLGSGASGGLFTPTLSTGAVLGGFLGTAWSLAGPVAQPSTPGVMFGRYRTVAFDGCTSVKVPDTARNRGWLGKMRAALGVTGYPAVELMTLAETGTGR